MVNLLTIAIGYCLASNVEIPVTLDESEFYWLNASFESATGHITERPARIRFSAHSNSGSEDEILRLGPLDNHIRVPIQRESSLIADTRANIGVHPASTFIDNVGPVAVIRTDIGSRIVLNSTQEYWENKCLDASILTFPVDQSDRTNFLVPRNVTFRLLGSSSAANEPVSWTGSIDTGPQGLLLRTVALVPLIVTSHINDILTSAGAVEYVRTNARRREYTNCTEEMIESLPDLAIEWPTIGQIVFPGPDYIQRNSSSNTCSSRLRLLEDSDTTSFISPLQYHELNVRIARDSIQFCDPRF